MQQESHEPTREVSEIPQSMPTMKFDRGLLESFNYNFTERIFIYNYESP